MPPGGLNIRLRRHRARQGSPPARLQARRRSSPSRAPTSSTASSAAAARRRRSASSRPARAISTSARRSTSSASTRSRPTELGLAPLQGRHDLAARAARACANSPRGSISIIVVEEKRSLIETQVKEQLYDRPDRAARDRQEGRERAGWLFPADGALEPTDIAIAIGERLVRCGAGETSRRGSPSLKRHRGNAALAAESVHAHALLLRGLPAQLVDRGAGRLARLCRHRLPLHGAVDGSRHRGLHPDGRRGRQLDRRSAVLQARARLPEPRRRHLPAFRLAGDARGGRRRRQHHLQDPLQRRRRHDRRSERSTAASRCR